MAFSNRPWYLIDTQETGANKKLIMVKFNYRLGIHGFLCLGREDVPGNGGNLEDDTLEGFSAESASVVLPVYTSRT
jgi:hypothetical protein